MSGVDFIHTGMIGGYYKWEEKEVLDSIDVLHNYNVKYIFISDLTRKQYPTSSSLFESSDCFDVVYETQTTKVFKVQCILRT